MPVGSSAAGSLGPWVPGQRGRPHPTGREGRTGRNQGSRPRAGCPAAVQGTGALARSWATHRAGSLAWPSPQCRVSAPSEEAAPRRALRQAPQQGLRAWGQGCPGAAEAFCSQEAGGMPPSRDPPHTHTHTALPSRLTPPSQQAPGSSGLSLTHLEDAVLQGGPCQPDSLPILLTFRRLPCAEHRLRSLTRSLRGLTGDLGGGGGPAPPGTRGADWPRPGGWSPRVGRAGRSLTRAQGEPLRAQPRRYLLSPPFPDPGSQRSGPRRPTRTPRPPDPRHARPRAPAVRRAGAAG